MKAPILGFAVVTAAFAGGSLYLWSQLQEERVRTAQLVKTSRELQARLVAPENARGELHPRLMAGAGGVVSAGYDSTRPPSVTMPPPPNVEATEGHAVWTMGAPNRSPAFQKMMRSQIRAGTRRQYADVGETLGLSKEKTAQLIQMLADQQADISVAGAEFPNETDAKRDFEQQQRENDTAISDLIGPDKAQALKEYQESIPARMEAEMMARQLDDNGAALSEAQKKRLVAVVVEERGRVPMPEYIDGNDQMEYSKSVNAWMNDYDRRVAAEASHVLNAEQLSAYNDIQQLQKDMREQFASAGIAQLNAPGVHRVVGQGNVVTFTSATPAFVQGAIVNAGVSTSAEKPDKK